MGPPSYMRSVVDRNVVMRRMTLIGSGKRAFLSMGSLRAELGEGGVFFTADSERYVCTYVKEISAHVVSLYVQRLRKGNLQKGLIY